MKHYYRFMGHVTVSAIILMIFLSALLLSNFSDKKSTPAVASYYNFIIPKVRLTDQYNHQYDYRFHPNPHRYMVTGYVTEHRHVKDQTKPALLKSKLVTTKRYIAQLQAKRQLVHQNRTTRSNRFNAMRVENELLNNIRLDRQRIQRIKSKLKRTPDTITWRETRVRRKVDLRPITYHERKISHHKIVYLHANFPIWNQPYRPGVGFASATNELAKNNQAMNIIGVATSKKHRFYEVTSGGYVYGWVPAAAVKTAQSYQIPFHYYSQLKPIKAPDACEAFSLRMALSAKGYDPRISMRKFINRIPRSKNPNRGYTANPYHYGDDASIYPPALAKYGRRYDPHVYVMKDVSKSHLIQEIEDGNPVVYEGSYRMKNIDSEHVLVLVGYSNGDLEFADPWYQDKNNKPISWVSLKQFTRLFHQRGARAVVVK